MAVNITCTGNIFDNVGTMFTGSDVYYQIFFYKVNAASSSSTWSNTRSSILGQYNFNLADSDLLTTAGSASSGDRVVVVFWTGVTIDRNSDYSFIDLWGAFEIILGSGPGMLSQDVYVNDVSVTTNLDPILSWSLPTTGYVNTSYTATNTSYDTHSFTISGTTMYHWYSRYGQIINAINQINNSDYYWGDDTFDLDVSGIANKTHQWSVAGTYEVNLVVEDNCNATVTGTKYIDVKWHPPSPDIIMIPSNPYPNEPVLFQWDGVDTDNTILYIDWVINDSGVYGNTNTTVSGARDDVIAHLDGLGTSWCGTLASGGAFTNPGSHVINIAYHWYDGFDWHHDTYNKSFIQELITGPTVDFTQVPTKATMANVVKFINNSSNIDRVGLGLPDCNEYDWTFTYDDTSIDYLDKLYSYELEVMATSTNSQVELCAWWSDGWDTHRTCVYKDVVFATTVSVTPNDCYYDLYILGTSDNGSVTGYSWTISSGTTCSGSWTEIWSSPIDIDQQEKSICFTSVGWYNITGYIYGTGDTLYDNYVLYIDDVCPTLSGVVTCSGITDVIWNGTGVLDLGGDWVHSGYGTEQFYAMRTGTNGLDATGMVNNNNILFYKAGGVDVLAYDILVVWINLLNWSVISELSVAFQTLVDDKWTTSLNLSTYINVTLFNEWQRAVIPLYQFELSSNIVHKLRFTSHDNIGVYLDDISFGVGVVVPIGLYSVAAEEIGEKTQQGREESISIDVDVVDLKPYAKLDLGGLRPNMKSRENVPSLVSTPVPTKL